MVKKVKLDTLDIEEAPVPLTGKPAVEAGKEKPSFKWPFPPWIFLSLLAFSMLFAAGVLSYRWAGTKKAALPRQVENIVPSASPFLKDKTEALNDFLIILGEDKGGNRAMVFDVVLELDVGRYPEFQSNVAAMRNIIYKTVEKKQIRTLMRPEGRNLLKNEINTRLAGLLGKGAVKAVYFTKFALL